MWEDGLNVEGSEVSLTCHVHNQAIMIPETNDAVRALIGLEPDGARSIARTDAALGIRKNLMAPGRA